VNIAFTSAAFWHTLQSTNNAQVSNATRALLYDPCFGPVQIRNKRLATWSHLIILIVRSWNVGQAPFTIIHSLGT
jgi:hypothetical protein